MSDKPKGKPERDKKDKQEPVRRGPRLDTPLDPRRGPLLRGSGDTDRFGRFAENFARFMGTAQFLLYMSAFVVIWISWNAVVPEDSPLSFDAYPFIFLTLMLSLQASYAAPLILLAQNRQEVRDRVVNEQDRQANARGHADMEFLAREVASLRMAVGEVATRDFLRSELRNLLDELADERERADGQPDGPVAPTRATAPGDGLDQPLDRPRDRPVDQPLDQPLDRSPDRSPGREPGDPDPGSGTN